MLIKGAQLMEKHLIDVCCNMKGSCAYCKKAMIRSDLDNHICNESPEQTTTGQAALIERLKKENASKTKKIKQYEHALTQQQIELD
jgi:hypothetical protein